MSKTTDPAPGSLAGLVRLAYEECLAERGPRPGAGLPPRRYRYDARNPAYFRTTVDVRNVFLDAALDAAGLPAAVAAAGDAVTVAPADPETDGHPRGRR